MIKNVFEKEFSTLKYAPSLDASAPSLDCTTTRTMVVGVAVHFE